MTGESSIQKWKVQIKTAQDTEWVGNQKTYDSQKEAEDAGADLYSRWMAVTEYRVVPC